MGRNPHPKIRGDEEESDIRCDVVGTSERVIAKSSIRDLAVFYKSGPYVSKV